MRVLIAGILGGIIMFAWGFVSHDLLGMYNSSVKPLPSEDAIVTGMSQSITDEGLYFFPGLQMDPKPTAEQRDQWQEKFGAGPYGIVVFQPGGGASFGRLMGTELASNVVAALLAAIVAAQIAGFGRRFFVVFLIGPIVWLSVSVSYWNWFGFPTNYLVPELIDYVGGWLLVGLVIAAIAKPSAKQAS